MRLISGDNFRELDCTIAEAYIWEGHPCACRKLFGIISFPCNVPHYSDHVPHYSDHTVAGVWSGVELVIGKGEKGAEAAHV